MNCKYSPEKEKDAVKPRLLTYFGFYAVFCEKFCHVLQIAFGVYQVAQTMVGAGDGDQSLGATAGVINHFAHIAGDETVAFTVEEDDGLFAVFHCPFYCTVVVLY